MASKLYGQVESESGSKATRQAHRVIEATLQTAYGAVVVILNHEGNGSITLHNGPVLNASKFSSAKGSVIHGYTFSVPADMGQECHEVKSA